MESSHDRNVEGIVARPMKWRLIEGLMEKLKEGSKELRRKNGQRNNERKVEGMKAKMGEREKGGQMA